MAKRTVIAADEELLVQGTLTVTGNVTQVESTQLVNRLESDELVINADGDDVTSKLILKSNSEFFYESQNEQRTFLRARLL